MNPNYTFDLGSFSVFSEDHLCEYGDVSDWNGEF